MIKLYIIIIKLEILKYYQNCDDKNRDINISCVKEFFVFIIYN